MPVVFTVNRLVTINKLPQAGTSIWSTMYRVVKYKDLLLVIPITLVRKSPAGPSTPTSGHGFPSDTPCTVVVSAHQPETPTSLYRKVV